MLQLYDEAYFTVEFTLFAKIWIVCFYFTVVLQKKRTDNLKINLYMFVFFHMNSGFHDKQFSQVSQIQNAIFSEFIVLHST